MTDPRIRYDIEATATGAPSVEQLAKGLEALQGAIDPQLADRARNLGDSLQRIGQQQSAIETFQQVKTRTVEAAAGLQAAQEAAQQYGREIAATETPTRAQVGQMEKLKDAVRTAKAELIAQTSALDAARAGLQSYGVPLDGVAAKQAELNKASQSTREELQQLHRVASGAADFKTLVGQTDQARVAMEGADRALSSYRATLSTSGPVTAKQAAELQRLEAAAQQTRAAFESQQTATLQAASGLKAAGVSTETLIGQQRQLASEQTRAAAAATQFGAASQHAGQQAQQANQGVQASIAEIGGQLRTIQGLVSAAIGGQIFAGTLGEISKTADAYSNLAARTKLATGEGDAFRTGFEGIFEVANRTSSSLETTGNLFTRITRAGKEMNLSQRDALALTESINQAVQLSGASAESSDAAITQLIQGLQSGVLRGEEFNSVMEQSPRLAQALADGLGLTTGKLREQAQAGALTSQVVINALRGQSQVLQTEFNQLPPTVGRAITQLNNEWTRYVGQVDQANGISATAARSIQFLATHLDTLASALFAAGKAGTAYAALRLAQNFLANSQAAQASAAAKVAETEATAANTAAQATNTAATVANTAAKRAAASAVGQMGTASEGAIASAGRLAGIFSTLKTFTFLGVLTNLPEISTWIGESAAKLMGWGKAAEEAEQKAKYLEEAQRAAATAAAADAQARQIATEKMLGLNDASRKMVAEFDGVIKAQGTVSEGLDKIAKAANLGDMTGIKNASAALDALAVRGKIAGDQVAKALADALKGEDLVKFESQARASFDSSEQGARRLGAALAAIDIEALRRAGTSADELKNGFNAAATSAINDLDTLVAAIERVGVRNNDTARAIAGSLDRSVEAANTERAVREVMARFEELGRQGQITGDQMAAGLEKAQAKLDALRPGINSLDEALSTFGLKSREELQRTADKMASSWEQIRNSTQVSIDDKIRAFQAYRDAAAAANNGIVPSQIAVQEEMLKIQQATRDAQAGITDLSSKGVSDMGRLSAAAQQASSDIGLIGGGKDNKIEYKSVTGNTREERLKGQNAVDATGMFTLRQKLDSGTLTTADEALVKGVAEQARQNMEVSRGAPAGAISLEGWRSMEETANIARRAQEILDGLKATEANAKSKADAAKNQPTVTPKTPTIPTSSVVKVDINLNGRLTSINTADQASANALLGMLEQFKAATGG